MGINAKKQKPEKNSKENNAKEKLERDLRSCMKCKYFWGNDNRCINNEKCGAGKQKKEKQQESKCVGLPLTRFGAEKDNFIKYLSKKRELEFKFENRTYRVNLIKVSVFPQCYAAVADKMPQYDRKHIVVDIGSWTMDLMTIKNMKPELSECDTRPMGLITCMHAINKECVAKFNCEIDESELEYVMKTGMCDMEERFAQVVEEEIRKFTNKVFNTLRLSRRNPNHIRMHQILVDLDKSVYKSQNQFIVDAVEFYINALEEDVITNSGKQKRQESFATSSWKKFWLNRGWNDDKILLGQI